MLSNDGQIVATIASQHLQEQELATATGVRFWNKDGNFRSVPLSTLCANPPKTQDVAIGPIGEFWRSWHRQVLSDGETFTIDTYTDGKYTFRFDNGEQQRARLTPQQIANKIAFVVGIVLGAIIGLLVFFWLRARRAGLPSKS